MTVCALSDSGLSVVLVLQNMGGRGERTAVHGVEYVSLNKWYRTREKYSFITYDYNL